VLLERMAQNTVPLTRSQLTMPRVQMPGPDRQSSPAITALAS